MLWYEWIPYLFCTFIKQPHSIKLYLKWHFKFVLGDKLLRNKVGRFYMKTEPLPKEWVVDERLGLARPWQFVDSERRTGEDAGDFVRLPFFCLLATTFKSLVIIWSCLHNNKEVSSNIWNMRLVGIWIINKIVYLTENVIFLLQEMVRAKKTEAGVAIMLGINIKIKCKIAYVNLTRVINTSLIIACSW